MTPEGKVKDQVKKLLDAYDIQPASKAGTFENAAGWYYMPVQAGYGVRVVDFIGHYRGIFWACEAKVRGKNPTGFQKLQIDAISCSGGSVFIVDGPETLKNFEEWLEEIDEGANFQEFLDSEV